MSRTDKSISLSFILSATLVLFACGSAWAAVGYNTTAIEKLDEKNERDHAKYESDHDLLLRIDENIKTLMKE